MLSTKFMFTNGEHTTPEINEFAGEGAPLDFSNIPMGILNGTQELINFNIPIKGVTRVDSNFSFIDGEKISYNKFCKILEEETLNSLVPNATLFISGIDSLYIYCVAQKHNIKLKLLHYSTDTVLDETQHLCKNINDIEVITSDDIELDYNEYSLFCPPLSTNYHYYNVLFTSIGKKIKNTIILGQGAEHVLQQRIWFEGNPRGHLEKRMQTLNNVTAIEKHANIKVICPYVNDKLAQAVWNLDPKYHATNFWAEPQKRLIQEFGIPLPTYEYNQHDILPRNSDYDLVKHLNSWIKNYRSLI